MVWLLAFLMVETALSAERCLLCDFEFPDPPKNASTIDPCEDLFGAACLDKEGTNMYAGTIDGFEDQMEVEINRAKDAAIRKMGYKNFSEALKGRLKEEGLEVDSETEEWRYFNNPNIYVTRETAVSLLMMQAHQ